MSDMSLPIMWSFDVGAALVFKSDGDPGTAYRLDRDADWTMPARDRAVAKGLLLLALQKIEREDHPLMTGKGDDW